MMSENMQPQLAKGPLREFSGISWREPIPKCKVGVQVTAFAMGGLLIFKLLDVGGTGRHRSNAMRYKGQYDAVRYECQAVFHPF